MSDLRSPIDHNPEVKKDVAEVRLTTLLALTDEALKHLGVDPERLSKGDPGLLHASREEALIEARIWIYRAMGRQPEPPGNVVQKWSRPKRKQKSKKRRRR